MSQGHEPVPRVPPRWFVRLAWYTHRALYRLTGGRIGLWRARPNRWGTLRLTTTGRRTHQDRSVILGYLEDGPNLITLAMNGWADGEPGGLIFRRIRTPESTLLTGHVRLPHGQQRERSGPGCGPSGVKWSRPSTPTRRYVRLRPP
jgi:F420H(2)-dependent quinone reductase